MLSGDIQLMLLLTPTVSFKLAEPVATKQIGPCLLPGFTTTLESSLNGCVVENGAFREGSSGLAKLRTHDSWAEKSKCLKF